MSRHFTRRTKGAVGRYLSYGSIRLIGVENRKNRWHVPGCGVQSTDTLIDMANQRGLTITLTETSREGSTTVRLN